MKQGQTLKKVDEEGEILTREQCLRILSSQARQGSVTAAATLVRELRKDEDEKETSFEDELAILTK